jgi:hypothetical protein
MRPQAIDLCRSPVLVESRILNKLKVWGYLDIRAELNAVVGFKHLLKTVIEPAIPQEYADAAGFQIILVLGGQAVYPVGDA